MYGLCRLSTYAKSFEILRNFGHPIVKKFRIHNFERNHKSNFAGSAHLYPANKTILQTPQIR